VYASREYDRGFKKRLKDFTDEIPDGKVLFFYGSNKPAIYKKRFLVMKKRLQNIYSSSAKSVNPLKSVICSLSPLFLSLIFLNARAFAFK
jgi:hypothetical protein